MGVFAFHVLFSFKTCSNFDQNLFYTFYILYILFNFILYHKLIVCACLSIALSIFFTSISIRLWLDFVFVTSIISSFNFFIFWKISIIYSQSFLYCFFVGLVIAFCFVINKFIIVLNCFLNSVIFHYVFELKKILDFHGQNYFIVSWFIYGALNKTFL